MATSTTTTRDTGPGTILASVLWRKCHNKIFFWTSTYEKEQALFIIKHNGEGVIEFRDEKNSSVKFTYEMKNCIAVYLRTDVDHNQANWPDNAEVDHCFIIEDKGKNSNVFLIAEEASIAKILWKKELDLYLANKDLSEQFEGKFSIEDLAFVRSILMDEQSFPSDKWRRFGYALDLSDDTLLSIETCYSNDNGYRIKEILSIWWSQASTNNDTSKRNASYAFLVNALYSMGEDRAGELVKNQQHMSSSRQVRSRNSESSFAKPFASTHQSSFDFSRHRKMHKSRLMKIFEEMTGLSNEKRSSQFKIINKTSRPITLLKCFIVKGKSSEDIQSEVTIFPDKECLYTFEKYTDISLEGCAAILVFTTDLPNLPTKCFFLVAFRNNCMIQITKQFYNRAIVLLLNNPIAIEMNSVYFGTVMRNEAPKPTAYELLGSYQGDKFGRTFMSIYTNEQKQDDFGEIGFDISMWNDYDSLITLKVLPSEEEIHQLQPDLQVATETNGLPCISVPIYGLLVGEIRETGPGPETDIITSPRTPSIMSMTDSTVIPEHPSLIESYGSRYNGRSSSTENSIMMTSDVNVTKKNTLSISDLDSVINELLSHHFPSEDWLQLGLHLGLHHNTLKSIKYNCQNCEMCLIDCLAAWLNKNDKVEEKGGSSWCSLTIALKTIGQSHISREIFQKYVSV